MFFLLTVINSKSNQRFPKVLMACAYFMGAEVFLRMTDGAFFYETSKYLVIAFVILGMLFDGFKLKAMYYLVYILLLLPGIFMAGVAVGYTTNIRTAIAFNLSGPVCLGIAALYSYDKSIYFKHLKMVFLAALLPLITTGIYLFLYTPNIRDVVTGTQSNFAASGGFGPNQVATVMGLGMFIMATRFFMDSKSMLVKILNLMLLSLMAYRGIVTFSRGGMITGFLMILFFLVIYYMNSKAKNRAQILKYVSVLGSIFIITWFISSFQTMGFIDKRYANQDALGREKEDVTTGRADLVSFELNEFVENPFLGVGVGKIKELRLEKEGKEAASHNEVSRILSEHGLFGFLAFSILFLTPLFYRIRNKKNIFFYSCFLFWFLTINHSAMRIAAPAFIYALSLVNVKFNQPIEKNRLHR